MIDEREMKDRVPATGSDTRQPLQSVPIFIPLFLQISFPDRTQDEREVQAIVICSITIFATLLISAVAISLGKLSTKNWQEHILLILAFLTFVNFKSTCNYNMYLFSSCINIFFGHLFQENSCRILNIFSWWLASALQRRKQAAAEEETIQDENYDYGQYFDPNPRMEVTDTNVAYSSDYEAAGASRTMDNNPYYK